MPSVLKFGTQNLEVAKLVQMLKAHGCAPSPPVTAAVPKFGRAIENMVLYFQMTHQGRTGEWLEVDGIVGEDTWWALENATGDAQRSFLETGIPMGIEGDRRKILETAVKEHGVREDPGRPNRGDEVEKYYPASWVSDPDDEGPAWCCFFMSWVTKQALGRYVMGELLWSCYTAWERAVSQGKWEEKNGSHPTPGDAFVILHKKPELGRCTGHIGFVLQVAGDGRTFNTVEGNCGNRVKIGKRSLSDPNLRGFINFFGDHPEFVRGSLRGAKRLDPADTR